MKAYGRTDRDLIKAAVLGMDPGANGWWRIPCIVCSIRKGRLDKKKSLTVSAVSGYYSCFRCECKGFIWDKDKAPKDRPEIVVNHAPCTAPSGFYPVWDSAQSLEPARRYLRSRGVPEDLWRIAGIGACVSGPEYGRVIVPVRHAVTNDWLGWVGRAWIDKCDKAYKNAPGAWRTGVLYNQKALHVETDAPLFVVEGVFDALHLWPDAVALLGGYDESQLDALSCAPRPVVIVNDGDAWEKGEALANRLKLRGCKAGWLELPPRADPDEFTREELVDAAYRELAVAMLKNDGNR